MIHLPWGVYLRSVLIVERHDGTTSQYRDILIPVITLEFKVARCMVIVIDAQELPSVLVYPIASGNIEIRVRKGILENRGLNSS